MKVKEYFFGAEETATPTAKQTKAMSVGGEVTIEPKSMAVGGEVLSETKGGLNKEPPGENLDIVARDRKTGREKPIAKANDREKIVRSDVNPAKPKVLVNPSELDIKKNSDYFSPSEQAQKPESPLISKYNQENIKQNNPIPMNTLELKNQNPDRGFTMPKQHLTPSAFRAQQINSHFRETNDYYGEHSSIIS